jgi:transcriptional regulator with XRE-family HTH domain
VSIQERFSANLRRVRKSLRMTQTELALMTELHRTQISLLERGKRMPRLDTLVKLVSALGCRSDDLIEGLAWMPEPDAHGRWVVEV